MFSLAIPSLMGRLLPPSALSGDVTAVYFPAYDRIHHGLLPYSGFHYEYPPGTLLPLFLIPSRLTHTSFAVAWCAEMLVADALITIAIVRLGHMSGSSRRVTRQAAWAWLAGGVLLVGLPLARNDLVACAMVVWAYVALRRNRLVVAGFLLGLGTVTKIWPLLILALLLVSQRRERAQVAIGAGVSFAVTFGALLVTGTLGPCIHYLLAYHGKRGVEIEAPAALPAELGASLRGRRVQIVSDYGSANLAGHAHLATATTIATAILVVATLAVVRARRGSARPIEYLASMSVALIAGIFVTTKVLSPQYLPWLLAIGCVAFAVRALPSWCLVAIIAATGLTGAVFPFRFADLVQGDIVPTVMLAVRDGLLVATAIGAASYATRRRATSDDDAENLVQAGRTGEDFVYAIRAERDHAFLNRRPGDVLA